MFVSHFYNENKLDEILKNIQYQDSQFYHLVWSYLWSQRKQNAESQPETLRKTKITSKNYLSSF